MIFMHSITKTNKYITKRGLLYIFGTTVIYSLVSAGVFDPTAFAPAGNYILNPMYWIVKIIVSATMGFASYLSLTTLLELRSNSRTARLRIYYFGIALVLSLGIWASVYPGIISVDEANVLYAARHLDIFASWHHILTNIWYAVALSIFPTEGSVTLLQVILQSGVIAFGAAYLHETFGKKYGLLFLIFFMLPQMLSMSVTPHRTSFVAILEVLLLLLLVRYRYENQQLSSYMIVWIGVLVGILATWRLEESVFLFFVPAYMYLCEGKRRKMVQPATLLLASAIPVSIIVMIAQGLNPVLQRQYQVTGVMGPLSSILKGGSYQAVDKMAVKQIIDKAINYDDLVQGKDVNEVYWSRQDRSINEADLALFKGTYVKLVRDNPLKYIEGATRTFLLSGITNRPDMQTTIPKLDLRFTEGLWFSGVQGAVSTRGIIQKLLKGFIPLGPESFNVYRINYANPIAAIILVALLIFSYKRALPLALLACAVLAKTAIIFVSAPMPSTLYYYSTMLSCGVLCIVMIAFLRKYYSN